jgi:hypothetical protein
MSSAVAESRITIEAELNYLQSRGQRPVAYAFEPPAGVPQYTGVHAARRVTIRNARALAGLGELTLDQSGFEKITHASAIKDFSDADAIRSAYYPESAALLKRLTGAEKVVIFDHTLRDSAAGGRFQALREPARRVHNDQTFVSGPRRVRDHLPPDEAELRLKNRFAIINLWRPVGHAVDQFPLAMCDARTIAADDLVPGDLVYRDKVGETYAFTYSARHSWYYYPQLTPQEALLLKIYDSREDGTARLTAHTSFEDPTAPEDARPRRSIELRALVFYPPGVH